MNSEKAVFLCLVKKMDVTVSPLHFVSLFGSSITLIAKRANLLAESMDRYTIRLLWHKVVLQDRTGQG